MVVEADIDVLKAQLESERQECERLRKTLEDSRRAVLLRNDFLAMVAHDLRSPLTVIVVTAGVLLRMMNVLDAGRPARKLVERIQRSTALLNHFVSDLLDISSVESGHLHLDLKPQPITALIEETCDTLSALCEEKGLVLRQEVRTTVGALVLCDKVRFLQLMSNLIGNAIKFTARGGSITLGVKEDTADFIFSVADTGVGIADADLPHIFDQYWKAKRNSSSERMTEGGFGLGLAIVRNLVEAHGGTVSVRSQHGKGSVFTFTLKRSLRV